MNWMVYTLGAALALAAADVLVKLAAGKLPNSLGLLLYGTVPFVTGLAWFLTDRARGNLGAIEPAALLYAVGVGIAFTTVTIALYAAFRAGAPISIVSPSIRLGGLLLASVIGFLFWKEVLTIRYVAGILLACSGVYLIISR